MLGVWFRTFSVGYIRMVPAQGLLGRKLLFFLLVTILSPIRLSRNWLFVIFTPDFGWQTGFWVARKCRFGGYDIVWMGIIIPDRPTRKCVIVN